MKHLKTDPKLMELLEMTRSHVMTAEEREAQRASWVKGEMAMGTDADEAAARGMTIKLSEPAYPGSLPNSSSRASLSRDLRADINPYRAIVERAFAKYDPEGLLKIGTPADEYEPEIKAVLEELRKGMNVSEVWIIICNTLHWYFGKHSRPVLYWNAHMEMATEIVAKMKEIE